MTDTERVVAALQGKAEKARAEADALRHRGYAHTYEHTQLITRAEAFEEAAAMARHPAMAAHR
jgi:hypothetical protein